MKTSIPLLMAGMILTLTACSSDNDGRPIPGTVEATNTKWDDAQNNTPRTNPTPNPDPDSQPPDSVTRRTVIQQQ
jgi:hypothetical protein